MTRREKLEAMLAQSPSDPFLHYGLSMELMREGNVAEAIDRLKSLTESHPDYQAAYFQLGQALADAGDVDEAKHWLTRGIDAAQRVGDTHAAAEMEGFLMSL